ncbi:MAG TPA: PEPxxWA-CTERM sorting domain-containing protein [Phenylobacterium sp.]|nr:PEPxxWA-CTERM sorting domain-containing protein [Phenylobacterium sp.]
MDLRAKGRVLAAMGLVTTLGFGAGAQAGQLPPALDQSVPRQGVLFAGPGSDILEQEVTAGKTGLLTGITLYGNNFVVNGQVIDGDGSTDVVQIAMGGPRQNPIPVFSATVELTVLGTFIDTSAADIQLTAGESFLIDVTGGDGNGVYESFSPYAGGDYFDVSHLNNQTLIQDVTRQHGIELAFQTFVQPPPTPEPATWALMLMGFGALGAALRRRRAIAAGAVA